MAKANSNSHIDGENETENDLLFAQGLFVKVDNGKEYYFDIAQAPLEFINDQLCLKGKITFKMPDVKQRRIYCYFLKQNDNLKNVIERIQNLPEVIILILANFSSSVFLDKSFVDDLHVANLKVTLPVYVISSETGQELQKQDKEGKELFCTLPPIKCKVQTSCTENALVQHLKRVYPVGRPPIFLIDNSTEAQILSSAFTSDELLKDKNICEAMDVIQNQIPNVIEEDFLFYIHLLGSLWVMKQKFNEKTSSKIKTTIQSFLSHLFKMEKEKLKIVLIKERESFAVPVKCSEGVVKQEKILHSIHKMSLELTALRAKPEHICYLVLISLKISIDCKCTVDSDEIWMKHFCKIIIEKEFTEELLFPINQCLSFAKEIQIQKEFTFLKPDLVADLILRNRGKLRKFKEVSNFLIFFGVEMAKDIEKFSTIFYKKLRERHVTVLTDSKLKSYIEMVASRKSSVLVEGFHFLSVLNKFMEINQPFETNYWIELLLDRFFEPTKPEHMKALSDISREESVPGDNLNFFFKKVRDKIRKSFDIKQEGSILGLVDELPQLLRSWPDLWNEEITTLLLNKFTPTDDLLKHVILINELSKSFPGANHHSFIWTKILQPIAIQNKQKKPANFYLQLLMIDAPELMIKKNQDDEEFVENVKKYLIRYCKSNQIGKEICKEEFRKGIEQIKIAQLHFFNEIALSALSQSTFTSYQDRKEKDNWKWNLAFQHILSYIVKEATPSPAGKLYSQTMNFICSFLLNTGIQQICSDSNYIEILTHQDESIRKHSSQFSESCAVNIIFPEYSKMFDYLKKELNNLTKTLSDDEATYDILKLCESKHSDLVKIAENLHIEFEFSNDALFASILSFESCQERISNQLIKGTPNNMEKLIELLRNHGVSVDEKVDAIISECFLYPPEDTDSPSQQLSCGVDEPLLRVKESVTLSKIKASEKILNEFLQPLSKSEVDFFVHFVTRKSTVFKNLLNDKLPNGTLKINTFSKCLEDIKLLLIHIFVGEANFREIKKVFLSVHLFEGELTIFQSFPDFQNVGVERSIKHLKNAVLMEEVVSNITALSEFCKDFQLSDHTLLETVSNLKKIVAPAEVNCNLRLEQFTSIIQQVKTTLNVECLSFLQHFKRLTKETRALRDFLSDYDFHTKDGQDHFYMQHALVTQQLQHEEHDGEILDKLYAVLYFVEPLLNPHISIESLIKIVSNLETDTLSTQLQTVNSNMDIIRIWFENAEGDTLAKTENELNSILREGKYSLSAKEMLDDRVKLFFKRDYAENNATLSPKLRTNYELCSHYTTWNLSQIREFEHKIGLLNIAQKKRMQFGTILKKVLQLLKLLESLHSMGEDQSAVITCTSEKDIDKRISEMTLIEEDWLEVFTQRRIQCKWLSFFKNAKVLALHKALKTGSDENFQDLIFLVHRCDSHIPVIQRAIIKHKSGNCSNKPIECVGDLLDSLNMPASQCDNITGTAFLHQLHGVTEKNILMYIIALYKRIPKPFELLRCHSETSKEDVELFLQRVRIFPSIYVVVEVNLLPTYLQETFLKIYMEIHAEELNSTLHIIETSGSILWGAPHIREQKISPNDEAVISILQSSLESSIHLFVVYGLEGNGKTYYINEKMDKQTSLTVPINETFSEIGIIKRLQSLSNNQQCNIHLNFTFTSPESWADTNEKISYGILTRRIEWFFFQLLILGYVEDGSSGESFGIFRKRSKWNIYIEVPAHSDSPESDLEKFFDIMPVFSFLNQESIIEVTCETFPYNIDDDVQLVCKYLRALKLENKRPGTGINKLFRGDPVRFGSEADLPETDCIQLLDEHMSNTTKKRKISQKMFIKYMSRRCKFLEQLPAFNFNQGIGVGGKNIKKLGSILLTAMIKEAKQYCDRGSLSDWSDLNHQQLIYESGGSIGLISLYPEQMDLDEKRSFLDLGIAIPSVKEMHERPLLDEFLSRGLSLPLAKVTEQVYDDKKKDRTRYKKLDLIDEHNYVLTLDFTLKMLSIHERKECGIPVIIEGETGVGKTELLKMLSRLWNWKWQIQWKECKNEAISIKKKLSREIRTNSSYNGVPLKASKENINWLMSLKGRDVISLVETDNRFLNFHEELNKLDIHSEVSPTELKNLMECLLTGELSNMFYKLDVHAGLKSCEIIEFFTKVSSHAKRMQKRFNHSTDIPQIIVFLDELNTSSCMGLLKEIVVDKSSNGETLPSNIFIVAAINPHRGNSLATLNNSKKLWLKPSYRVHRLHPTLEFLKWDYGALDEQQELEYIAAKMRTIPKSSINNFDLDDLSQILVKSQNNIRMYAAEALRSSGLEENEIMKVSRSSVSQRDIQRVFVFFDWIYQVYCNTGRYNSDERQSRALLVSLGLVYYIRLDKYSRQRFTTDLDKWCVDLQFVRFSKAFEEELEWYVTKLDLPYGIAKTTALKENLFTIITCCQTKTPLIILGEPGTSKTLSFNLVSNKFKVVAVKRGKSQDLESFRGLEPYFYQCSRHTESCEIETIFRRAIDRQQIFDSANVLKNCVVFMDEAGLPEERHESLKVLHYHLDHPVVSFVAITNYALDAAKSNRAVCLYRPEASTEDLNVLANEIIQANDLIEVERVYISYFCKSFFNLMKDPVYCSFYGQRDFMKFLVTLRNIKKDVLKPDTVVQALEFTFNGHLHFPSVCEEFLQAFSIPSQQTTFHKNKIWYHDINRKNFLTVLKDVLKPDEDIEKKILEGTNPRYKLIIDQSEDDSATRMLIELNIVDGSKAKIFVCSDFAEESYKHINTVSAIRLSAERGDTVFMFQTEKIHESFYELFNQRFRVLSDPKKGRRFFTTISIGAHTKPCKVDSKFQCIVVVNKSEMKNTPSAFLNRFDKFSLSYRLLFNELLSTYPPNLQKVFSIVLNKVSKLITTKLQGYRSLYGHVFSTDKPECSTKNTPGERTNEFQTDETLLSLFVSILPPLEVQYDSQSDIQTHEASDLEEGNKNLLLLTTILTALRKNLLMKIPKVSTEELLIDCEHIFQMMLNDEDFALELKNTNFVVKDAVGEAIDILCSPTHCAVGVHEDSCLVIAIIVQWLIRFVTRKCLQILTPESIVVNAKSLPQSLIKSYFCNQEHFNLKRLVTKSYENLDHNKWNNSVCPNKLLCYTRDCHIFHLLPTAYPASVKKGDFSKDLISELIFEKSDQVKLFKVTPELHENDIRKHLKDFLKQDQKILILLTDMEYVSNKKINHIRIILEHFERNSGFPDRLFLILLHFPPSMMFTSSYPVLFLSGWNHYYLDSIFTSVSDKTCLSKILGHCIINIESCFKTCLDFEKKIESMNLNVEPLVEEAVLVITSRIQVGSQNKVRYNTSMTMSERCRTLKFLLLKESQERRKELTCFGRAVCEVFKNQWTCESLKEILFKASSFNFNNMSTLSITSYLQTTMKAKFFEYLVFILHKLNEGCEMDMLYCDCESTENHSSSCTRDTIEDIFIAFMKKFGREIPSLEFFSTSVQAVAPECNGFIFPFFNHIHKYLEEMLEEAHETVGKATPSDFENKLFSVMVNKLTSLFKESEELSTELFVVKTVIQCLQVPTLWDMYLTDFINVKFVGDLNQDLNIMKYRQNFINLYFGFDHHCISEPLIKLTKIYVKSEVSKLDLASTIHQLHRLVPFLASQPVDASQALISSIHGTTGESLGFLMISWSFKSLVTIVNNKENKSKPMEANLIDWYMIYQNTVQIASLYNAMHMVEDLRLEFTIIHLVYIQLKCNFCSENSFSQAFELTFEYCKKLTVYEDNPRQFLTYYFDVLNHNHSEYLMKKVITDVIWFLLHCPREYEAKWFLEAPYLDECNVWFQHISENLYTECLNHLISKNNTENSYTLLEGLHLDLKIRTFVGNTIVNFTPGQKLMKKDVITCFVSSEGIMPPSTCIGAEEKFLALPKCYACVIFKKLLASDKETSVLLKKIEYYDKELKSCSNTSEHNLLLLEREAFMQKFLKVLSVELAGRSRKVMLRRIPARFNEILNSEGCSRVRGVVLCMYMWDQLNNTSGLLKALNDHKDFKCLESFQCSENEWNTAKSYFTLPKLFDQRLSQLYKQICIKLESIHSGNQRPDALKMFFAQCMRSESLEVKFNSGPVLTVPKLNGAQMCLWLCIYYNFYQKEVLSEKVKKAVLLLKDTLSHKVITIMLCFLDSNQAKKIEEQDLSDNPNVPVFEFDPHHGIRSIRQHSASSDPVFDFFFSSATSDDNDHQLRSALASIVAVSLLCQEEANHLWYHLFFPDELSGTYVTGFMFDSLLKEGRLYDCGVELSLEGNYGRPEYLQRAEKHILSLQSLYLLLWSNFGAFCISLLTQKDVYIKGTVISDYHPVRHYCFKQMKLMWVHLSASLGYTLEQQMLFINKAMLALIQVTCSSGGSQDRALFVTAESRDDYERMWQNDVFSPAVSFVKDRFEILSEQVRSFSSREISNLKRSYPKFVSLQSFFHHAENISVSSQSDSTKYEILIMFLHRYNQLKAAGILLPKLIKFYLWLHTYLPYLITEEEAAKMTVADTIVLIVEQYHDRNGGTPFSDADFLEKFMRHFNEYVETVGGTIGVGACANIRRENKVPKLSKETPIFRLLPGATIDQAEEERDYLYLVINDMVMHHNAFLKAISNICQSSMKDEFKHLHTPITKLPIIHPAAVDRDCCIIPENSKELMTIVYSNQENQMMNFDLMQIQEDIFVEYILGRSQIGDCSEKLHRQFFNFKPEVVENGRTVHNPTECLLNLQRAHPFDKDLMQLVTTEDEFINELEYQIFAMNYETLIYTAQWLLLIAECLNKALRCDESGASVLKKKDVINLKLKELVLQLTEKSEITVEDLKQFEIRIQGSLAECIKSIPVAKLHETLKLVIAWIEDGVYDFHALPRMMKHQLSKGCHDLILEIPSYAKESQINLLAKLKSIVTALSHSEKHFATNIDALAENEVFVFLRSLDLLGEQEEELVDYFPKEILVKNYMSLRITLRRLINMLDENTSTETERWNENVEDLWTSESKLKHIREQSTHLTFKEVLDPDTFLYGFQSTNDSPEKKTSKSHSSEITQKIKESDLVKKVGPEKVEEYLESIKMEKYVQSFLENKVDGEMMLILTTEDLKETLEVDPRDILKIQTKFKTWLKDVFVHTM